jgi:hypothetical protein
MTTMTSRSLAAGVLLALRPAQAQPGKTPRRAGVVEVADFELLPGKEHPKIVDIFRNAVLGALAEYPCSGDHVFEQGFQFKVD